MSMPPGFRIRHVSAVLIFGREGGNTCGDSGDSFSIVLCLGLDRVVGDKSLDEEIVCTRRRYRGGLRNRGTRGTRRGHEVDAGRARVNSTSFRASSPLTTTYDMSSLQAHSRE